MGSKDFLPRRDLDFCSFARNFADVIGAAPAAVGLSPDDASALAGLSAAFDLALQTALEPSTRSPVAVALKDSARAALDRRLRAAARVIRATRAVTDAQRQSLGLPVPDRIKTPIPPPLTRPVVALVGRSSRSLAVRLVDEQTPTSKARPRGSAGAHLFAFVGETPPPDLRDWRHIGTTNKPGFIVGCRAADAGKTAHIRAAWFNRKGQSGPVSEEIVATVAA